MDKSEFINTLSKKIEMNDLYPACIDSVFETRYFVNDIQVLPSFQENLKRFVSEVKLFLTTYNPNVSLRFRGVLIEDYIPVRDELIHELNQLISQD